MLPSPFIPLSASPTMSHYLNLHPYSVPHHCKWVHQYFSGFRFIPFCGWVIFHCIYVAHLLYLFFCQQTSRLLPCPGYCKHSAMNIEVHVSFSIIIFSIIILQCVVVSAIHQCDSVLIIYILLYIYIYIHFCLSLALPPISIALFLITLLNSHFTVCWMGR